MAVFSEGFDFEWQGVDLLQNREQPWTRTLRGPFQPFFCSLPPAGGLEAALGAISTGRTERQSLTKMFHMLDW